VVPLVDVDAGVSPDGADTARLAHVRPPGWVNPTPAPVYDLLVIGGGTAGLVCAMGAAGLGARVALVERHLLGGDCLNTGCVPSKALIRSAKVVGEFRRGPALGVTAGEVRIDFGQVMERVRARRAAVAAHDAAERLRGAGVDVFFGDAVFVDRRSVAVGDRRLRFRRAVIATGSRAAIPPIAGLETVPFLTNESVFELRVQPQRLLVIGAGPIGCEVGQAFARLGSSVTLIDQSERLLPRDDPDAAAVVARHLRRDGVRLELGVRVERAASEAGGVRLTLSGGPEGAAPARALHGDALLVAAGRVPNVDGLNLDAAGVRAGRRGVEVNDRLQTSNPRVYASGDVCSDFKFTHAADALSRVVLQNALFFGRRSARALVIPWVTYTDPEVAHVGVIAGHASSSGRLETITVPLSEVDRAIVDDATDGFVRVHHDRGRLSGCTIVAPHAGEMIGEAVYVLTHGGSLTALSGTVHPYPTASEALRKAGDVYRRQALTPRVRRWLTRYFTWTRG
jgi:pyruvate/2-oxoglutarate dehydrogenase complex dihydrolipoamide dehydrogenase (E3) component